MLGMAKKQTRKKPVAAVKTPKRTGEPVFAYIDAELRAALDDFLAASRPAPSITGVLSAAIEDFLKGKGFWPRPVKAADDET